MLKILTCECTMSMLEEKGTRFSYTSNLFDCNCGSETHEVFATVCKIHPLNLVGFPRRYFAAATCYCWSVAKDVICNHCLYLAQSMNFFCAENLPGGKTRTEKSRNFANQNFHEQETAGRSILLFFVKTRLCKHGLFFLRERNGVILKQKR